MLRREKSEEKYRNEYFSIWRHYYLNTETKDTYTTTKLDQLNLLQIHNQYRARHHVPFPVEIKQIREQYGLSAAKMSQVLDLGINSYRQYEAGYMPSLVHAKLIKLVAQPDTFEEFVGEKQTLFSPNRYDRLLADIDLVRQQEASQHSILHIWNNHMEANEYTGFVKPHFEKVAHFVLYLAQHAEPLKTRLNKLLFYCDFLHYKRTGYSISGCNYRAIQLGPVPSHYHELFGLLESLEYVRIEEELYDHGGTGERFTALKKFDRQWFSPEELNIMNEIVASFKHKRTKELIETSHLEQGWEKNKDRRDLISYQAYAFDLKGV